MVQKVEIVDCNVVKKEEHRVIFRKVDLNEHEVKNINDLNVVVIFHDNYDRFIKVKVVIKQDNFDGIKNIEDRVSLGNCI